MTQKNQSTEFYKAGIYALILSKTLREMVTMLRSRDVIHRGQASF